MTTEQEWKDMTPAEKRNEILALAPSLLVAGLDLAIEEREGKVARFVVHRYNQGKQRGGGEATVPPAVS